MTIFSLKRVRMHARGFTLVETLVATFIVTMVILGPLTVASNASSYARITKDSLIATYLAQEAIELLHLEQDSVYIRCIQSDASCVSSGNETQSQTAWRVFKERLGGNASGASCYATDNSAGCSYDFLDVTTTLNGNPTKYASDLSSCSSLALESATGLYVCRGVRGSGAGYALTKFSRKVSITSIPTFTASDASYNDDLRVTVTVSFRRPNGFIHQLQVVDFLHARS